MKIVGIASRVGRATASDMSVVEFRCPVAALGSAMTEMRCWLDHHDAGPNQFDLVSGSAGVIGLRLQFHDARKAFDFARAFDGQLTGEPGIAAA